MLLEPSNTTLEALQVPVRQQCPDKLTDEVDHL